MCYMIGKTWGGGSLVQKVVNHFSSMQNTQVGNRLDPNIRIIDRDRFSNTEIRRRVNFSLLANFNSFAEFYNYILEILNSLINMVN